MEKLNIDGTLLRADQPVLMSDNRSFRFGDGLFESIRVINGAACFLSDHLQRLRHGMEKLKMKLPSDFTDEFIKAAISELIRTNGIEKGGRIRLTVFRRGGGQYMPKLHTASVLIEANAVEPNQFELNEQGYNIDLYELQRKPINEFCGIKSNSALFSVIAAMYREEKQLDECIVINELGSISEGVSHNIFIVFNGVLYTPSDNQGCLPGVMRKQLIKIGQESGIEVQECPLNPAVLLKADEVLFTNAVEGIRWALSYKSKRYYNNMAKKLVGLLNAKLLS